MEPRTGPKSVGVDVVEATVAGADEVVGAQVVGAEVVAGAVVGADGVVGADRSGAGPRAQRSVARQRRANVLGGRRIRHQVLVTLAEEEHLARLAAAQRVTVPRLLVESALAQQGETATQRRDALVELLAVRRLLTAVSVNVNQVAAKANAMSRVPPETAAVVSSVRRLVVRIDTVLDGLDGQA